VIHLPLGAVSWVMLLLVLCLQAAYSVSNCIIAVPCSLSDGHWLCVWNARP